jgi:regulatory protein
LNCSQQNPFENEVEEFNSPGDDSDADLVDEKPRRPRKKAREKVMDLLARRDHSELELKRKLSAHYSQDEIADAIEYAKENKWMKAPQELAETVARQLGRRGKGAQYIRRYLQSRGLPGVSKDVEEEHRKALEFIEMKLDRTPPFAYDEQAKIARLLKNRGYDDATIRKVIHEKP